MFRRCPATTASKKIKRTARVLAAATASAVACCGALCVSTATAAVSSSGDVTPMPPAAGGAVAGPLTIGNVDVGTMNISGGTALTNSSNAVIGGTTTGLGIVTMSGFGSDWTLTTAGADFTLGNSGTGSMTMSGQSFVSVIDDLFVAAQLNSIGELTISNLGTIFDVGDSANIAQRGQGIVEIFTGGRLLTAANIIGDEAAGDGRVTVSGQSALWRATSTMTIADAGRAVLQVFNGGRVENTSGVVANSAGSSGAVEVSGDGSIWQNSLGLFVGEFGHGTLTVSDGGRVSVGTGVNLFTIGRLIGSTGTVEIRGAGSLLTAAATEVGDSGDGTLRILEGGRVTSGTVLIGDNSSARGEALVDGVGSSWEVTGEITVSDPGEAHLTISNGGLARSSNVTRVATLGRLTLDRGRLEIGGTVGLLNTGVVEGSGTIEALKVDNNSGGRLRPFASEPLLITGTLNNAGLVDVNGGTLEVIGPTNNNLDIDARGGATLRFRGAGLDNNSGSQLAITAGNVDVFGLVNNDAGAEIAVGGTAVAVFHDAVTNNGTIFVQPGGQVLMLENLGFTSSSTLSMPLKGSDGFGQVDVAGNVQLSGEMAIALSGGFVPQVGDQFTVLTSAARSGTFDAVTTSGASGIEFHGIYTPTDAAVIATGAGDKTWGVDASGNSSLGANWLGGVAPGGADDRAAFTTIISATRTVTIDAPLVAGSLYFDDNNDYVLSGASAITLDVTAGAARIDVKNLHGNGAHTIAAPLSLNDHTVIDVAGPAGRLNITGPIGAAAPGASLTKAGAGSVVAHHVTLDGALAVDAGTLEVATDGTAAATLRARGITVAGGARLEMNDNDFIVDYTGTSPEFTLRDHVKAIVNGGTSGIAFTEGAGDVAIAVAEKTEWGFSTFNGFTIDDTTIVGKYTYFGDANLDGRVTSDDYVAVDVGLGTGDSWVQGDFNFSGTVTSDDYVAIDVNLGKGTPTPLAFAELKAEMVALHTEMFGAEYVQKLALAEAEGFAALVPEPDAIGALVAACALAAGRRRRGHRSRRAR